MRRNIAPPYDAPSRNFNDGNPAGPARRSTYDALGRIFCDGNSDFTIVQYDPNSVAAYDGNSAANTQSNSCNTTWGMRA